MTGIDPYARSLVLWMLGLAALIYALKIAWRFAGSRNVNPHWSPPGAETFLVGMATLILVMAPVHMAKWNSVDEVLNRWSLFLAYAATAAFAAGFLSGLIDRARPIVLGLSMAWPSAFYAAMAWAFFLLFRSWIPPEDAPNANELVTRTTPFLALVTGFPAASLVCGVVGGILGAALGRRGSALSKAGRYERS